MDAFKTLLLYLLSAFALLVALFCVGVYVREIFLSGFSDDKSLLFWYLPFLFVGILSLRTLVFAVRLIRERRIEEDGDGDR